MGGLGDALDGLAVCAMTFLCMVVGGLVSLVVGFVALAAGVHDVSSLMLWTFVWMSVSAGFAAWLAFEGLRR